MTARSTSLQFRLLFAALLAVSVQSPGNADALSPHPLSHTDRSLFIRIDTGAGVDADLADRSPLNSAGQHKEAYSAAAFVLNLSAGFRFNEYVGIEGGWTEQRHAAHPEWGGSARYSIGTVAFRAAIPTASRQTPFFIIGASAGAFSYGTSELGDNSTWTAGPTAGLGLEHEINLGIVLVLQAGYTGLYRDGMDSVLVLEDVRHSMDGTKYVTRLGSKDFSKSGFAHLAWVTAGVQFEWLIN